MGEARAPILVVSVTLQQNEVCVAQPPSAVLARASGIGRHSRGRLCHTNHDQTLEFTSDG